MHLRASTLRKYVKDNKKQYFYRMKMVDETRTAHVLHTRSLIINTYSFVIFLTKVFRPSPWLIAYCHFPPSVGVLI